VKYFALWLGSSYTAADRRKFIRGTIRFDGRLLSLMAFAQADGAAKGSLMAHCMRAQELVTIPEARRELAAEVRDLADLLDSQEPDYLALHDAW
jgi:hypothetical protein